MGTAIQQQRQQSCQKAKSLHPVCQMLQKRHPQNKSRRNEPHGHSGSTTTPAFVEKDQIVAPNASKATSTRQVSKKKTHGHSVTHQQHCRPSWCKAEPSNNVGTTSERRPSTWGTTSRAISGRGNYCQPRHSFPFLCPYPSFCSYLFLTLPCRSFPFLRATPAYHDSAKPTGTHTLRFISRGLEIPAPHRIMTILGRVMRTRSAPRVSVARHELGQAPSKTGPWPRSRRFFVHLSDVYRQTTQHDVQSTHSLQSFLLCDHCCSSGRPVLAGLFGRAGWSAKKKKTHRTGCVARTVRISVGAGQLQPAQLTYGQGVWKPNMRHDHPRKTEARAWSMGV